MWWLAPLIILIVGLWLSAGLFAVRILIDKGYFARVGGSAPLVVLYIVVAGPPALFVANRRPRLTSGAEGSRPCPRCGAPVSPGAMACPRCGWGLR